MPGLDANTGALGVLTAVLGWFMFKSTEQQESIVRALNALSRAYLLEVLTRPSAPGAARREARDTLKSLGVDLDPMEIR